MNEHADKEMLTKVLEQCGRQCQSASFIKKARSIYEKSKNVDEFIENLSKVYKHLHKEGDGIYQVYPKCYCSMVSKIPAGELAGVYCNFLTWLGEGAVRRLLEETCWGQAVEID